MAPTMFTKPSIPHQPSHSLTQDTSSRMVASKQKLKSISSFFPSFSHSQQSTQNPGQMDESHVIPYFQPESPAPGSIARSTTAMYDGLPSIKNGSMFSLPLNPNQDKYEPSPSQSISSLRLKVELLKQSQIHMTQGENQSPQEGSGITYTSHNLQAQISREIPTLASAIHIPDSSVPTSRDRVTARPSVVPPQQQNGIHPLYHMNASSTSLLGSYVQVNEIIHVVSNNSGNNQHDIDDYRNCQRRERSDSKASNNDNNGTITKRRMSRRLSLDNIVPKLTGSLRKRERSSSKSSVLDITGNDSGRRWSLFSSENKSSNQLQSQQQQQPEMKPVVAEQPKPQTVNQMAMPVSRNWRKKFTVNKTTNPSNGNGTGAIVGKDMSISRLEAARQAREKSRANSAEARHRYDERTIKRIPVKGGRDPAVGVEGLPTSDAALKERQSMISMMGRGNDITRVMRDVEGDATNLSFVRRPSSIASSFDPAITPKSTSSIPIPFVPTGPPLVSGLPETQTGTSLAATFDSPSPLPRPVHTPSNRFHGLGVPATSRTRAEEMFSPAQDDRSILDPARSPYPIPDASPLVPLMSSLQYQNMPLPPPPTQQNRLSSLQPSAGVKDSNAVNFGEDEEMRAHEKHDALDMSSLDESLNEIASQLPNTTSMTTSISTVTATIIADPSQTGTFGVCDSTQMWHNFKTSPPPPLPASTSTRTIYTLPRSKSKSHTDLSSFASSKNLVDHTEATQGPGWWSTDKKINQRNSTMTLRNRKEEVESEVVEKELERLERLAQSTTLPHRSKFDMSDGQIEIMAFPNLNLNRMKEEDKLKTRSSLDLRSSYRGMRPSSVLGESVRVNVQHGNGHHARPSLMAGSIWSKDNPPSPRRSVLARQSTMSLISNSTFDKETPSKIRPAQIPLPPSEPRNGSGLNTSTGPGMLGTFISNRISPDIARRASFLSKSDNDNVENSSPSRSTSRQTTRTTLSSLSMNSNSHSMSTAPTSVQSDCDQDLDHEHDEDSSSSSSPSKFEQLQMEWESKIQQMKSRHTLEIDAVLGALSNFKNENQILKDENTNLNKALNDSLKENQKLKEKIQILCLSLQQIELGSSTFKSTEEVHPEEGRDGEMRRSGSVVSSLLPELIGGNQNTISPLPLSTGRTSHSQFRDEAYTSSRASIMMDDIDEFGRKPLPALPLTSDSISNTELRNKGIMNALSKSRRIPNNYSSSVINGDGRRNVSEHSITTEESNVLYDDRDMEENGNEGHQEEGWTLRLKEMDERYLDDM